MALANVSAELLLLRPPPLMEFPQQHHRQRNLYHGGDEDDDIDVGVEFFQDPALFLLPQQSSPFFEDSYRYDFPGVIYEEDIEDAEPEHYRRRAEADMFVPVFSPDFSFPDPVSVVRSNPDPCEDELEEEIGLPLDLFDRRPGQFRGQEVAASAQPQRSRVSDLATPEEGSDFLELSLGLNFGAADLDDAFDAVVGGDDEDGFVEEDPLGEESDWGPDGVFHGWRDNSPPAGGARGQGSEGPCGSAGSSNSNINNNSNNSNNNGIKEMDYEGGLRIVGSDSDSELEEECPMITEVTGGINSDCDDCDDDVDHILSPSDLGIPLCWDCLHIDEDRPDSSNNLMEEFEWEEVDARTEARDALDVAIDADDVRSSLVQEVGESITSADSGSELGRGDHFDPEHDDDMVFRNIEWEVLLAVNQIEQQRSLSMEPGDGAESFLGDEHDDFVYTSEYEVLFGQFTDPQDLDSTRGRPPAARSVVSSLPSIVLTQEDISNGNAVCAVCKDDISLEDSAKQLPCLHHYHGDCILPWLGIRNTCPVCRHELPTDDSDYENWRSRRSNSNRSVPPVSRNALDVLPED